MYKNILQDVTWWIGAWYSVASILSSAYIMDGQEEISMLFIKL
jgi:hypothetical protein